VSGASANCLRFNAETREPPRQFDVGPTTDVHELPWVFHPTPEIDVAVLPVNIEMLKASAVRFAFFVDDRHVLTREGARTGGVSEGDRVYVLGFPMGLVGEARNYVIGRQGCIARVRDVLAGESTEFLVDASVFPGNSGGPVVTTPELSSITGTVASPAAHLIGIVSYIPYQDFAISQQTGRRRIVFDENSGLASVVPYDFIAEAIAEREKSFPPFELPSVPIVECPGPPEDLTGRSAMPDSSEATSGS